MFIRKITDIIESISNRRECGTAGARRFFTLLLPLCSVMLLLSGCARMAAPDGGWYDETPPRVIGAMPADRGTNVKSGKVRIYFNEFIKLENATEKVVVSPPQLEQPEIKATGKRIEVELKDELKPNTTYTIDFSDAISDNNEGNPMGNYTYSFSTGDRIDTLECSGYVLNAEDLEPVKGILVGLYPNDSTVRNDTLPFMRVSRTDSRGFFVIRGIAPGTYTVGAVQDIDGDFRFTQRGELMAFSHQVIKPSHFLDHRQDTIWIDDLHIKDIKRVPYTHFMPDNIVLKAFQHELTDRSYLKHERIEADHFTMYFTAPVSPDTLKAHSLGSEYLLPKLRLLNAPQGMDADNWMVRECSEKGDTLTCWLRDTMLINQDTLMVEMTTLITDTAGVMQMTTDTLEVLAKTSYAKRMKKMDEEVKEWRKDLEKRLKAREKQLSRMSAEEIAMMQLPQIDTVMPPVRLNPKYIMSQNMSPDDNIVIQFPYPMVKVDTASVHLYVEQDSLWFRAPFVIHQTDTMLTKRNWELYSEWIPGANYSFEVDTLAFEDIYGHTSEPYKTGIKIKKLEDYSSLFVNVAGVGKLDSVSTVIVQLLNSNGGVVKSTEVKDGVAEFYYVEPGKYYLSAIIDRNGNGKWDTGDYYSDKQPEEVFYSNELIECKAKWDITKTWNINSRPVYRQKPYDITKQKADKKKTIRHRNADRAKEKGIPMPVITE